MRKMERLGDLPPHPPENYEGLRSPRDGDEGGATDPEDCSLPSGYGDLPPSLLCAFWSGCLVLDAMPHPTSNDPRR